MTQSTEDGATALKAWLLRRLPHLGVVMGIMVLGALPMLLSSTNAVTALALAYAGLVGLALVGLVRMIRRSAAASRDFALVAQVSHRLAGADSPGGTGQAICQAARLIANCASVTLLERRGDFLYPTASDGCSLPNIRISLAGEVLTGKGHPSPDPEPSSGPVQAFTSGQAVFTLGSAPIPAAFRDSGGCMPIVASLFQPVGRDGNVTGLIAMFWDRGRVRVSRRMQDSLNLLANEASLVFHESDLVARLESVARTDPLTQVSNLRAWSARLPAVVQNARLNNDRFSVVILDLDRFKAFNDDWGHLRGDLLLREVARLWSSVLREGDLLARCGGDEFRLLLPQADLNAVQEVLERMRQVMPEGQSFSAGVAFWDGLESEDELVERADAMLFEAKRSGRATHAYEEGTVVAGDENWIVRLPRILVERQVRAAFQPVRSLATGAVLGYEALARITDGQNDRNVEGLFSAAQRVGSARDLDWLCRMAAVRDSAQLPRESILFVNVGIWALLDPVHNVDQMLLLTRWGSLSPTQIVLEISEREAVLDLDRLRQVLADYRGEGFRFAVDDVGEGHSTLEVLAAASPEYIKIARSLTTTAHEGGSQAAVRALLEFARHSGASVIAEGLESEVDLEQMRALGVPYGQGFGLGVPNLSPLPARDRPMSLRPGSISA